MNIAWQLAVVDYDQLERIYRRHKKFLRCVSESKKKADSLKDGMVVYIASVTREEVEVGELSYMNRAMVWLPDKKNYGFAMLDLLHPILTHQDAVDMELKFGISLEKYIKQ